MGGVVDDVVKVGSFGLIETDFAGDEAASAARRAAGIQAEAGQAAISEQEAARASFEERTDPFRELGLVGSEQLTSFLEDPTQQLSEINPIVDFLRGQGFEQIQESAAARGRLGAGGTLKDLTQFNSDLTSTVIPQLQNQRFNQLFNTASLGANVAAGQGTAGLNTAANVGNLLGGIGQAEAGGVIGAANAQTNAQNALFGAAGTAAGAFLGGPGGAALGSSLFGGGGVGINQNTANNPNTLGTITPDYASF
jgi:hypothetical protein